jgi:hypothetical protein
VRARRDELVAPAGAAGGLPLPDDVGDLEDGLLAVAEHRGVDEVGDRFGVERGVPAGDHDRVLRGAVPAVERDAGEVEGIEQVRVAELGGEGDPEQVERRDRAVAVDGELRHAVLAHQLLEVGPDGVGALGEHVRALVEHLVQDLDALVGQADLVCVRVHEHPAHGRLVPGLDHRAEFAADVLDRLAHQRQQAFELREDARNVHDMPAYAHRRRTVTAVTHGRAPLDTESRCAGAVLS